MDQIGKKAEMVSTESTFAIDSNLVEKERLVKAEQDLEKIRAIYNQLL